MKKSKFSIAFSSRRSIVITLLKIGIIVVIFTIYIVIQFLVYTRFFNKSQFTLRALINTRSREPYLSAVINALRAELIESSSSMNYSNLSSILVTNFDDAFDRMKACENDLLLDKLDLPNYYPDLNAQLSPFYGAELCNATYKFNKDFNKTGCEIDLNSIMTEGVRECIGVILLNLYKVHQSFITEKDMTEETLKEEYIKNVFVLNLSKITKNFSGFKD